MSESLPSSLQEWLLLLETRHHDLIQLGLERIKKVAQDLDLIPRNIPKVLIGGTNGKGTTLATLEAIYCKAGYTVGSYTSPHLLSFNERIKINRKAIADEVLIEAFQFIEEGRGLTHLTYFEVATLAALWCFKRYPLDIVLLEVGMGGRLDATNIVDADLAVITTIDLDHQAWLGETREAIAAEKGGILRKNGVYIFADENEPLSLVKQADKLQCLPYRYGKNYFILNEDRQSVFNYQNEHIPLPPSTLHPKARSAAIMAALHLRSILPLSKEDILSGLNDTRIVGRVQQLALPVKTLIDVAHNPQSAQYLADSLVQLKREKGYKRIYAIFSALEDKDLIGLIAPLIPLVDEWYLSVLTEQRAASYEQLKTAFLTYECQPIFFENPQEAYKVACQKVSGDDLILVYGSFITVGKVMSSMEQALLVLEDS